LKPEAKALNQNSKGSPIKSLPDRSGYETGPKLDSNPFFTSSPLQARLEKKHIRDISEIVIYLEKEHLFSIC
jgi:hypothetical protein